MPEIPSHQICDSLKKKQLFKLWTPETKTYFDDQLSLPPNTMPKVSSTKAILYFSGSSKDSKLGTVYLLKINCKISEVTNSTNDYRSLSTISDLQRLSDKLMTHFRNQKHTVPSKRLQVFSFWQQAFLFLFLMLTLILASQSQTCAWYRFGNSAEIGVHSGEKISTPVWKATELSEFFMPDMTFTDELVSIPLLVKQLYSKPDLSFSLTCVSICSGNARIHDISRFQCSILEIRTFGGETDWKSQVCSHAISPWSWAVLIMILRRTNTKSLRSSSEAKWKFLSSTPGDAYLVGFDGRCRRLCGTWRGDANELLERVPQGQGLTVSITILRNLQCHHFECIFKNTIHESKNWAYCKVCIGGALKRNLNCARWEKHAVSGSIKTYPGRRGNKKPKFARTSWP